MAWYTRTVFVVTVVLVTVAVLCFHDAGAVMYEWVDGEGNVSFTDDLSRVPPSFRDKVKVIEMPEPTTGSAPAAAASVPAPEPDTKADAAKAYEACQERLKEERERWTDQLIKGRARLTELNRLIHRSTTSRRKNKLQRERVAVKESIAQAERMLKEKLPPIEAECESIRYWRLEE